VFIGMSCGCFNVEIGKELYLLEDIVKIYVCWFFCKMGVVDCV